MARRSAGLALLGGLLVAASFVACDGDDTNSAAPDAGGADATTTQDSGGSVKVDGGGSVPEAGLCAAIDAAVYDAAAVQEGRNLVVAMGCQVCHGESLSGNPDGVYSPGYGTAYPPNLTPDQSTGLGCWTDLQIETAFLYGVNNEAQLLCPPMPHFGEFEDGGGISLAQAPAVVAFLRSLSPIADQVPASPNCNLPPPDDGGTGRDEDSGEPFDAGHSHHFDGGDSGSHELDASDGASEDASSEDGGVDAD
jgi:cytochrome c5